MSQLINVILQFRVQSAEQFSSGAIQSKFAAKSWAERDPLKHKVLSSEFGEFVKVSPQNKADK